VTTWLLLVVPVLVLPVILLFAFTGCTAFEEAPPAPLVRVQAQTATGRGSATATWSQPTAQGNLLVAIVATGTASDEIKAPPGGWVKTFEPNAVGQRPRVEIWHYASNPGGRTSEQFTSPPSSDLTLDVREYAGAAAVNVVDTHSSNGDATGNTKAVSTGPTGTVAPAARLAVAGLANRRSATGQEPPSNKHVAVSNLTSMPGGAGPEHRMQGTEKIGDLSQTEQTGTNLSDPRPWSAVIAVFKDASA
jgi:hypothetical protein